MKNPKEIDNWKYPIVLASYFISAASVYVLYGFEIAVLFLLALITALLTVQSK